MEQLTDYGKTASMVSILSGSWDALSKTVHRVVGSGRTKSKPDVKKASFIPSIEPLNMEMFGSGTFVRADSVPEIEDFLNEWVDGKVGQTTSARSYSRITALNDLRSAWGGAVPKKSWTRLQSPARNLNIRVRNTATVGTSFVIDSDWIEEWIMKTPERLSERRKLYANTLQPAIG